MGVAFFPLCNTSNILGGSNGMHVLEWLEVLALGGLVGAAGQMSRAIVGIKKLSDEATATAKDLSSMIDTARLVTSLLIGAVAGALAAISTGIKADEIVKPATLLAFAAAGYAGTDFIEGFVRGYMSPSSAQAPKGTGTDAVG
jgi:hypothetical protein